MHPAATVADFRTAALTALAAQIFDIRSAERKPMVSPHGIEENLSEKRKPFSRGIIGVVFMMSGYSGSMSRSTWQCLM